MAWFQQGRYATAFDAMHFLNNHPTKKFVCLQGTVGTIWVVQLFGLHSGKVERQYYTGNELLAFAEAEGFDTFIPNKK